MREVYHTSAPSFTGLAEVFLYVGIASLGLLLYRVEARAG